MKKIKLLIYSPLLLLVLLLPFIFPAPVQEPEAVEAPTAIVAVDTLQFPDTTTDHNAAATVPKKNKSNSQTYGNVSRQEIVSYALTLLGKPYTYGGTTRNGFDCSGFTSHVFKTFGVDISRSSSLQANDGAEVPKEKAKPGDLVIFTGTNPSDRNPGHVGIVISSPGDTVTFVHSSSNGGVKISKVEGTRYNTRFLQIRRIL